MGTLRVSLETEEITVGDINSAADKVKPLLIGAGIKFKLTEFSYRE